MDEGCFNPGSKRPTIGPRASAPSTATRLGKVNSKRARAALAALERLSDDRDEDVRDQMHRSLSMIATKDRSKGGD